MAQPSSDSDQRRAGPFSFFGLFFDCPNAWLDEYAMTAKTSVQRPIRGRKNRRLTAAIAAREQAGLTVAQAAKRAGCSVRYLRGLELNGGVSWVMGMKLAAIYGCNCQVFLHHS